MTFDLFDSPELLDIQRTGFYSFLKQGIPQLLAKEFPIKVKNGNYSIELLLNEQDIKLINPENDPRDCILKMKTYSCKLYARVKIVCKESSSKIIYQSQPEWVFLGQLPMMTKRGHFIINGSPRVIVNQVVRAPGIYFQKLSKKDEKNRARFYGDIIPLKGVWVRLQMTKKGRIEAKFKKGKKIEAAFLQKCLQIIEEQSCFSLNLSDAYLQMLKFFQASLHRASTNSHRDEIFSNLPISLSSRKERFFNNHSYSNLHFLEKVAFSEKRLPGPQITDVHVNETQRVKEGVEQNSTFTFSEKKLRVSTGKQKKVGRSKVSRVFRSFQLSRRENIEKEKKLRKPEKVQRDENSEKEILVYDDYSKLLDKRKSRAESKAEHDAFIHTYDKLYRTAQDKELEEWQKKKKNVTFFKSSHRTSCRAVPQSGLPGARKEGERGATTCKPKNYNGENNVPLTKDVSPMCLPTYCSYSNGASNLSKCPFAARVLKTNLTPKVPPVGASQEIKRTNGFSQETGLTPNGLNLLKDEDPSFCFSKENKRFRERRIGCTKCISFSRSEASKFNYAQPRKRIKQEGTIHPSREPFLGDTESRGGRQELDLFSSQENDFKRKKCSENLFATFKIKSRYDLGILGREKINNKFGCTSYKADTPPFVLLQGKKNRVRYFSKQNTGCAAVPKKQSFSEAFLGLRSKQFSEKIGKKATPSPYGGTPLHIVDVHVLGLRSKASNFLRKQQTSFANLLCKLQTPFAKFPFEKPSNNKALGCIKSSTRLYHQNNTKLCFLKNSKRDKQSLFTKSYNTQLTSLDLCSASVWLHKLRKGEQNSDDIDHSQNRRVRTSGELLQTQFEHGVDRLKNIVSTKLQEKRSGAFFTPKGVKKPVDFFEKAKPPRSLLLESAALTLLSKKQSFASTKTGQRLAPSYFTQPKGCSAFHVPYGHVCANKGEIKRSSASIKTRPAEQAQVLLLRQKQNSYKLSVKELFSTKPITGALREFFGSNPLSQYMDQTNPLAEITHKRRISSLGIGGISRESAGMAIRGIHPTHYGRICPIETPEGKNAGLVNSLAFYTKVDINGFLKTPYYRVFKGQIQSSLGFSFCSAKEESLTGLQIAPSDLQKSWNNVLRTRFSTLESVPVRVADNLLDVFKKENPYRVQLIAISPIQMISVATSLIPFLEHNDANRALMGSNMQRQAVPLMISERPIVGTGLESNVIVESGHITESQIAGFASHITADRVVIDRLEKNLQQKISFLSFRKDRRFRLCRSFRFCYTEGLVVRKARSKGKREKLCFFLSPLVPPRSTKLFLPEAFFIPEAFCKKARPTPKVLGHLVSHASRNTLKREKARHGTFPTRSFFTKSYPVPLRGNTFAHLLTKLRFVSARVGPSGGNFLVEKALVSRRLPRPEGFPKGNLANGVCSLQNKLEALLLRANPGTTPKLCFFEKRRKSFEKASKKQSRTGLNRRFGCAQSAVEFSFLGKTRDQHNVDLKKKQDLGKSTKKPSYLKSSVHPLTIFSRSNQNTCITEKPLIQEFDWVQKGDVLTDCSASHNGELAVGKNVLVAYIPWEGYNFEDAIVISDRLVREHVYTSLHIERYVFQAQEIKDGNEWFTKHLPGIEPGLTQHLEESGLPKIGSFLKEGDILVGKLRYLNKKPSSPYERLLCDILGEKNFAARNKSFYVPKGVEARVIYHKVINFFDNDPESQIGLSAQGTSIAGINKIHKSNEQILGSKLCKSALQSPFCPNGRRPASSPNLLKGVRPRVEEVFLHKSKDLPILPKVLRSKIWKHSFLERSFLPVLACIAKQKTVSLQCVPCFAESNVRLCAKLNQKAFRGRFFSALRFLFFRRKNFSKMALQGSLFAKSLGYKKSYPFTEGVGPFSCSYLLEPPKRPNTFGEGGAFLQKASGLGTARSFLRKPRFQLSLRESIEKGKSFENSRSKTCDHPLYTERGGAVQRTPFWQGGSRQKLKSKILTVKKVRKEVGTEKDIVLQNASANLLCKSKICGASHFSLPAPLSKKPGFSEAFLGLRSKQFSEKIGKKATPSPYGGTPLHIVDVHVLGLRSKASKFPFGKPSGRALRRETSLGESQASLLRKSTLQAPIETHNSKARLKAAKTVHLFLGEKRVIQIGDKISGRHGNKGVISTILPRQDMPYLPDGTPIDIILNPLGVPSRMNVGQVLECLLGLASHYLNQHFKVEAFDERYGVEASKSIVFLKLYQARLQSGQNWLFQVNFPGKTRLIDGRSGECFDQWITVGKAYILKLIHMVSEKIHARSTGPYALITQQPLRGRSNKGGQRLGEMEVWAFEGFGAAYTLQELLTKKSDDFFGRKQIVDSILPNPSSVIDVLKPNSRIDQNRPVLGHPEIFKVLLCELQALCLDLGVYVLTPESFQRSFLGVVH